jgi:hypothetical protein
MLGPLARIDCMMHLRSQMEVPRPNQFAGVPYCHITQQVPGDIEECSVLSSKFIHEVRRAVPPKIQTRKSSIVTIVCSQSVAQERTMKNVGIPAVTKRPFGIAKKQSVHALIR